MSDTTDTEERAYIKKLCYIAAERLDQFHDLMKIVKMDQPTTKLQVELRLLGDHIQECGTRPILQAPIFSLSFTAGMIGMVIGIVIGAAIF